MKRELPLWIAAFALAASCSTPPQASSGSATDAQKPSDIAGDAPDESAASPKDAAIGQADSGPADAELIGTTDISPATDAAAAADAKAPPQDAPVDSGAKPDSGAANPDTAPDAAPDIAQPICSESQLSDVYQKKIKPLVTKGQPSTCNQCHFSGVDLSMFVQESPCKSMACMVEKGMVDFKSPSLSSVMKWIDMAKPQSGLITLQIQKKEHDAFLQWITWSAGCQDAVCGKIADPCGAGGAVAPVTDTSMLGNATRKASARASRPWFTNGAIAAAIATRRTAKILSKMVRRLGCTATRPTAARFTRCTTCWACPACLVNRRSI